MYGPKVAIEKLNLRCLASLLADERIYTIEVGFSKKKLVSRESYLAGEATYAEFSIKCAYSWEQKPEILKIF